MCVFSRDQLEFYIITCVMTVLRHLHMINIYVITLILHATCQSQNENNSQDGVGTLPFSGLYT